MRVHRFFVTPDQLPGDTVRFSQDQAHQLRSVLRLRIGDVVRVFDGHTPVDRMFAHRDVYGIGYDEERVSQPLVRLGIVGAGGVAQSKHLPAINRLRTLRRTPR